MSAKVINIREGIRIKIEKLDEDLDHQFEMYHQAFYSGEPTAELSRIMTETEREINILEERVL